MTTDPIRAADRRISIVVPSYNRAAYLEGLLTSLTWSVVPSDGFEVIVVNDGGTDDLATLVHRWRARGLDVRLLAIRASGPPRNNARARNAGLAAARYPLVLQTDPDIVFVDDVVLAMRDHADGQSFCSCDGYYPLTQAATAALGDPARPTPATAADFRRAARGRPNQVLAPDGVGGLHGALATATDCLRALGGYDESFEHWGWEDRELLVTATAMGIARRHVPATAVVHQWHPLQRGESWRELLAGEGQVSQTAWEIQWQRAAAEHPRPLRPRPVVAADGRDTGPRPFSLASVGVQAPAVPDARGTGAPLAHQLFFTATCAEADELRQAGHVSLARHVLWMAMARPWESHARGDDWRAWATPPELTPTWRNGPLGHYAHATRAIEALALCDHALGDEPGRDRWLAALDGDAQGRAVAAAVRARCSVKAGMSRLAAIDVTALEGPGWTAERAALGVEILLRRGDMTRAREVLAAWPRGEGSSHYFDRLRAAAYASLAWGAEVPEPWSGDAAANDVSEFLFSAAMRSERDGLDLAAAQLFTWFRSRGGPAEPRVQVECRRRLAALEMRLAAAPDIVGDAWSQRPAAQAR